MVLLARQPHRTTRNLGPLEIAALGIVGIELRVAGHKQIEAAVVIVVSPTRTGIPAIEGHACFLGDIGKRSVVIIVIEAALAKVGDVNIRPAIIVVVADRDAESPTLIGHASLRGDIGKGAIMIVVQEHGPRRRLFALKRC